MTTFTESDHPRATTGEFTTKAQSAPETSLTAGDPRAAAKARIEELQAELAELAAHDPDLVAGAAFALLNTVTNVDAPAATVGQTTDPDYPDEPYDTLLDPYTGEPTTLVALDMAVREIPQAEGDLDVANQSLSFHYSDVDSDFDGYAYRSSATGRFISMPAGWIEGGY
jgi:hypothetical protein